MSVLEALRVWHHRVRRVGQLVRGVALPSETQATRVDAELRLAELQAARAVLLPDADDPEILSELTAVESQMRSAQQAIASNNA
jgi:hypothetical protein